MGSIASRAAFSTQEAGVLYVQHSDDYYERKMHDADGDSCHEYYDEPEVDEYIDCMDPYELYDIPIIDKTATLSSALRTVCPSERRKIFTEPLHRVNMLNVTFVKPVRVL